MENIDSRHHNNIAHHEATGPGGAQLQLNVLDHATTIAAGVREDLAACDGENAEFKDVERTHNASCLSML